MKIIFLAFLSITQLWSTIPNQEWSPPPPDWIKLNFALANSSSPPNHSVAACLARSSEGVFLGGWATHCGPSSSPSACAARLACLAASSHGFFSPVVLESDGYVQNDYCVGAFEMVGVDRSANEAAHVWANWALGNDFEGFLVGDDLTFLVHGLDQL